MCPESPGYEQALGADFGAATRAALEFLHQRLDFTLWMVTRANGDESVVLVAKDHGYGIGEGALFRWSDSFCTRMVQGAGPRFAPRVCEVAAYLDAPVARQVQIRAYIGVPIEDGAGQLFGTLCAIDPHPQPEDIISEQPLVELMARLLGTILAAERDRNAAERRAERAEQESQIDVLTGLGNRRGWEHVLDREEARCRRYGDPAAVLMIDLDGLKEINDTHGHQSGDQLLRTTADVLLGTVRDSDYVARLGGDEFGVLAVQCGRLEASELRERLDRRLEDFGVRASVGLALRHPPSGLPAAWRDADAAMYQVKRQRRDHRESGIGPAR